MISFILASAGVFTVTGNGDIAPLGADGGWTIERLLIGVVFGFIVVSFVSVRFAAASYRTLTAKAIVVGTVCFICGLAACTITALLGKRILLSNGNQILPVSLITELRVMIGTSALLAVASVFTFALAVLFQRKVAALVVSVALVVLPYILAIANVMPLYITQWLLRLTPAAGIAIQQSIPEYPQVIGLYIPQAGYFPLSPWVGFIVLCGYTASALCLADFRLRRSR